MHADIAIVGGGPVGLATARAAAACGASPLVFERRSEGARSSCCTGLVSPRTLSVLHVSQACVLQRIRAACIHFPGGKQIRLRSSEVKAFTICRQILEAELLQNARSAGADVRFDAKATSAVPGRLDVRSASKDTHVITSVIIGADGPQSRVAQWLCLDPPEGFAAAAQAEVESTLEACDQVEIFVGEDVAPGFFGWCVPAEEGVARVGVGVLLGHNPSVHLDRLLAKHFPQGHVRSRATGLIPLATAPRSAAAGVFLVGDAAGHVKPLSGGGLYTGGVCAQIAGELAAQAAQSGVLQVDLTASYSKRCLDAIGREVSFGRSTRHHLAQLQDCDVEAIADVLEDQHFLQFVADHADIDQLHRLPDHIASDPHLWTTLLRLLPLLGRSLA